MNKNYVEVPLTPEQDINQKQTKWFDDKCISLDEGTHVTIYIAHFTEPSCDFDGNETTIMRAYPIRISKPISRDKLINAAEMQAYGLATAMDVASFNASLARKSREGEDNADVKEHDEFISWIKEELTKIGI